MTKTPQLCGETASAKWKRLYPKWATRYPVDPEHPGKLDSWLDSKWKQGLGVGCRACAFAGFTTRFGLYQVTTVDALQKVNFDKHERSPAHKAAIKAFNDERSGANVDKAMVRRSVNCPPLDTFKQIGDSIVDGSGRIGSTPFKGRVMWCLKEALAAEDRDALESAFAISLFRDERNARLAVRYRAVNRNLVVFSGTLGQARHFGTGATKLTDATEDIINRMCTKFSGVSAFSDVAVETKMPALMSHVREKIMCITVDSAGDELLAGELMRNNKLSERDRALTPNLKFVLRDAAHASRRIISRPWNADAYVREVALMMAQGRCSVAKLVQNSNETMRVFKGFVTSSTNAVVRSAVTNMRAAGHRFESWQKPLGRTVLHMHACIKTALYVANRPAKDDNTDRAKEWLNWVNSERCLLLAMMADVADEGMCLTRLLDCEDVDPAVLNQEVFLFSKKIGVMFGDQRRCLNIFGYTSVMLDLLKEHVVWYVNGHMRSIGYERGVPGDVVDRCIQRMRSYVVLARAALAAEFPSFEISQVTWVSTNSCRCFVVYHCCLVGPWGLVSRGDVQRGARQRHRRHSRCLTCPPVTLTLEVICSG